MQAVHVDDLEQIQASQVACDIAKLLVLTRVQDTSKEAGKEVAMSYDADDVVQMCTYFTEGLGLETIFR